MKSLRYQVPLTACLMATGLGLSACGGAANVVIPESLREPCVSTVDVRGATTIGDLAGGIIQGDADTRVCSVKKDAVIAIAEARNRAWWQIWR